MVENPRVQKAAGAARLVFGLVIIVAGLLFTLDNFGIVSASFLLRLWPVALVMVAGATVGGYAGAHFGRRIGKEKARAAVVVIGLGVTAVLLLQRA